MKRFVQWGIVAIVIAGFASTGFQCSSAEITSAKLYIQRKDYQSAEKQLLKEVEKNPQSEEGYFLLGEVRFEMANYRGMKEAFERALAVNNVHQKEIRSYQVSSWGRLYNLGVEAINKAADSSSYVDKAIDDFSTAIVVLPESVFTHRTLGLAYFRKGDIPNAAEQFTIALNDAHDIVSCRFLGRMYLDSAVAVRSRFTEKNREAFASMKTLQSVHEKTSAEDVKFILGAPASVDKPKKPKKGDTKEEWSYPQYNLTLVMENSAVKDMKFSQPFNPPIDSTDYFASVKINEKAVETYKKGQAYSPEDPEISEGLMNAYIGAGQTKEARALLAQRVQKYPDSKFDHYNLGVFLLKESNYSGAIDQFRKALDLDTSFSAARYNLAAGYVNWGVAEQESLKAINSDNTSFKERFRQALPYLEAVVQEKGNDVQMWELLGQVYANLSQPDKAKEAFERADEIRKGKE